jgi:hypothetical protein
MPVLSGCRSHPGKRVPMSGRAKRPATVRPRPDVPYFRLLHVSGSVASREAMPAAQTSFSSSTPIKTRLGPWRLPSAGAGAGDRTPLPSLVSTSPPCQQMLIEKLRSVTEKLRSVNARVARH